MQWNNHQMGGSRVPAPPHQQQIQMRVPGPQQQQLPPEMVHNMDHVFNENGPEVGKMQLEMGNETPNVASSIPIV